MIDSSIQGADELIQRLQDLSLKDAKNAIRKGSRAAAKIIAAQAKQTAPRKTGALASGFKVRAMPRSRRWVGTRVVETYRVAGFVEFGTKHSKGGHAMELAFTAVKAQATSAFIEGMAAEINKGAR